MAKKRDLATTFLTTYASSPDLLTHPPILCSCAILNLDTTYQESALEVLPVLKLLLPPVTPTASRLFVAPFGLQDFFHHSFPCILPMLFSIS